MLAYRPVLRSASDVFGTGYDVTVTANSVCTQCTYIYKWDVALSVFFRVIMSQFAVSAQASAVTVQKIITR